MRRAMRFRAMVSFAGDDNEDVPPMANMIGWWKADSIVGVADGAPVFTWSDSSGMGNTIQNLTGLGNEPDYIASDLAMNGKPSVSFDSTQWLYAAMDPVGMPEGSAPLTIYTAARAPYSVGRLIWYWGSRYGYNPGRSVGFTANNLGYGDVIHVDNYYIAWGGLANAANDPFVVAWAHTAGADVTADPMFLNGATGPSFIPAAPGALNMTPFVNTTIGFGQDPAGAGPGNNFVGAIAEVIVYREAHDVATIQKISSYLMAKYAIS